MENRNQLQILWNLNFRRRRGAEPSKLKFFRKFPFFEKLTNAQLKTLSKYLHERQYEENEYLFEQHQPGAALFFITTGEVVVEIGDQHKSAETIAHIKPGEFLGELALLDESPRSASARAVVPTHAYALSRAELNRLAKEHPVITLEIYKSLAWVVGERLRATNRNFETHTKVAA